MKYLVVKGFSVLFVFLLMHELLSAQIFTPYSTWNHAGINGVYLQPASIADTRLKFDMVLFGFDVTAVNNMYGLKNGFVTGGNWEDDFDKYKKPLYGNKNYRAFIGVDIQALNFMVTLSPKSALGFTARSRTMINIDGVNSDVFDMFDDDLDNFVGRSYSVSDLSFRVNSWAETGITYAREIIDLDNHYFKAGLTFKVLQPITSSYLYIENGSYQIGDPRKPVDQQTTDDIWVKANGVMAVPSNFNDFDAFSDVDNYFDDFDFGNMGFGFDFGVVYEYRPRYADFVQRGGGKSKWYRYEPSKYLFRIGISILDVGSMKYHSDWTQEISMRTTGLDVINGGVVLPEDMIDDFSTLRSALGLKQQPTTYSMALPTAISVQTDWRINRIFYLGMNPYFALRQKKGNKVGTHYLTSINVAPRMEMAGLGVSVPMTYNQLKSFNIGLGLQLGPLWFGSNNLFNMLASDNLREVNVCMGLKFSLYHRNKGKKGTADQVIIEGID